MCNERNNSICYTITIYEVHTFKKINKDYFCKGLQFSLIKEWKRSLKLRYGTKSLGGGGGGGEEYFIENSNFIRESAEVAVHGCYGITPQENTRGGVLLMTSCRT